RDATAARLSLCSGTRGSDTRESTLPLPLITFSRGAPLQPPSHPAGTSTTTYRPSYAPAHNTLPNVASIVVSGAPSRSSSVATTPGDSNNKYVAPFEAIACGCRVAL